MVVTDTYGQVSLQSYYLEGIPYAFGTPHSEHRARSLGRSAKPERKRSNSCVSTQCTDSRGSSRENSHTTILQTPVPDLNLSNASDCFPPPRLGFLRRDTKNHSLKPSSLHMFKHCRHKRWFRSIFPLRRHRVCGSFHLRSTLRDAATQTSYTVNTPLSHTTTVSRSTSFCTALSHSFCCSSVTENLVVGTPETLVSYHLDDTKSTEYFTPCYTDVYYVPCEPNMSLPTSVPHEEEKGKLDDPFCSNVQFTEEKNKTTMQCICGYPAHISIYDAMLPLHTGPSIAQGSYQETLAIAKACCGRWVTIVERSESLDTQYRCLGLNAFKRTVMNRLAIPLTMFLENEETVLHCWIHTPLGIRHMRSNLLGVESVDEDSDVGTWRGVTKVVDYSVPWFCNGNPFRALQQVRKNATRGTCIETRCILPDSKEGQLMLFNFSMIPKQSDDTVTTRLSANRLLRKQ